MDGEQQTHICFLSGQSIKEAGSLPMGKVLETFQLFWKGPFTPQKHVVKKKKNGVIRPG